MPKRDPLSTYRDKRAAGSTPEPGVDASAQSGDSGGVTPPGGGLFVIHKHAASRLHWDLRLEMNGTLQSWAVPKGPSLDPAEKRLAVHVEDHPMEYVDFEDVIPKGNYGAGPMIIWDRGTWVPLEDPAAGLESGKLLFELRGFKLNGVWTLVKLQKTEKEWLMIREKRHMARAELTDIGSADQAVPQQSILSGLTVEELGEGFDPTPGLEVMLAELDAPARSVRPDQVKLMLAHTAEEAFNDPAWLFELKLDGYRMLGHKNGPRVQLRTRNGHDATRSFPELVRSLAALPVNDFLLDGEVVMHDDAGHPSFQRLQNRARLRRPIDIKRASLRFPATFYAFDLLSLLGRDLRPLPLSERKAVLQDLLPPAGPLRFVEHFAGQGELMFEHVAKLGFEGIVAKKSDSRYRGGRSRAWLKIRAEHTADLVVVGYTLPKGSRTGFGALHLGGWRDGELYYAGRVGTGFTEKDLSVIREELDRIERDDPPFGGEWDGGQDDRWVEPEHVAEVRYLEWTHGGLLRQPAFVRWRDDKTPDECPLPEARGGHPDPNGGGASGGGPDAGSRTGGTAPGFAGVTEFPEVTLSNPDKVFWPDEGYTKRDLFEYYRAISPWMLPYLADRPLVLTRYPDGIDGKSFYQKNAPMSTPEWIRTAVVQSRSSEKALEYFVCDDEASLLYLANLGSIPLHIWASRIGSLDNPDWCILDLDPKGAPFEHVIEIARALHRLCDEIDLPNLVKTSGSSGLHVMIPLGARYSYDHSKTLGELLARVVLEELSDIATIARAVGSREGKVYIDYLQNRRGQLIAAPYSVRPVPTASVSTPLRWPEVKRGLDIHRFTIRTVPARVARMKDDPLLDVLRLKPDLPAVIERLAGWLSD